MKAENDLIEKKLKTAQRALSLETGFSESRAFGLLISIIVSHSRRFRDAHNRLQKIAFQTAALPEFGIHVYYAAYQLIFSRFP